MEEAPAEDFAVTTVADELAKEAFLPVVAAQEPFLQENLVANLEDMFGVAPPTLAAMLEFLQEPFPLQLNHGGALQLLGAPPPAPLLPPVPLLALPAPPPYTPPYNVLVLQALLAAEKPQRAALSAPLGPIVSTMPLPPRAPVGVRQWHSCPQLLV